LQYKVYGSGLDFWQYRYRPLRGIFKVGGMKKWAPGKILNLRESSNQHSKALRTKGSTARKFSGAMSVRSAIAAALKTNRLQYRRRGMRFPLCKNDLELCFGS
jgi:hypothetical protein